MELKCLRCGNTKEFTATAVSREIVFIDGEGSIEDFGDNLETDLDHYSYKCSNTLCRHKEAQVIDLEDFPLLTEQFIVVTVSYTDVTDMDFCVFSELNLAEAYRKGIKDYTDREAVIFRNDAKYIMSTCDVPGVIQHILNSTGEEDEADYTPHTYNLIESVQNHYEELNKNAKK